MKLLKYVLALVLMAFSVTGVRAATTGQITVTAPSGYNFNGSTFTIYNIGQLGEDASSITYSDDFKDSQITWNPTSSGATLAQYASANSISPVQTQTFSNGSAVFTNLPQAVYLVTGTEVTIDGTTYKPLPTLVSMPQVEDNTPVWNFSIEPKREQESKQGSLVDCTVKKQWSGDDANTRPTSIDVTLYQDGEEVETVTLNSTNSWTYTWESLDGDYTYSVDEKDVPENYTKLIEPSGTTYIITNTYEEPPEPNPVDPEKKGNKKKSNTPSKNGNIPQTGQLWWPVGLLAVLGLCFLILDVLTKKHEASES